MSLVKSPSRRRTTAAAAAAASVGRAAAVLPLPAAPAPVATPAAAAPAVTVEAVAAVPKAAGYPWRCLGGPPLSRQRRERLLETRFFSWAPPLDTVCEKDARERGERLPRAREAGHAPREDPEIVSRKAHIYHKADLALVFERNEIHISCTLFLFLSFPKS